MATMRIDEVKAMARRAHDDARVLEGLFEAMLGSERDEAVHAAWALTHLPKQDNGSIAKHREELAALATTTPDTSLRRITLSLLERIDWTVADPDDVPQYYVELLDFCMEQLTRAEETYGVRALCMKLAYRLSLPYPELLEELRQSLMLTDAAELSAGVRHTRNKILGKLKIEN